MDTSQLAARVASRHLQAGNSLSEIFGKAHDEVEARLAAELSTKWSQEIETRFSREFPNWEIVAEIDRIRDRDAPDFFRVSLRLSPSSRHPDKEWLSELEPEEGKAFDKWFVQEFGLWPSFWDTAMDMARGTREFPAYNGASVQVSW